MRSYLRYAPSYLLMRNNSGYVLVLVLLVLAVTTAVVIDFSRTVYAYVNTANNFAESERMSLLLKSAFLEISQKASSMSAQLAFNNQQVLTFEEKIEDTKVGLELEDNNSKFNVNTLVSGSGLPNNNRIEIFRRLLKELKIDEIYADRLVDYIDPDKVPRVPGGETPAKNSPLISISELGYVFPENTLKILMPYLTVYGDGTININTANLLLLKSLHSEMNASLAEGIVDIRKSGPFEKKVDVTKLPGMETIGLDISDIITVSSTSFNVKLRAERNDLEEVAEACFDISSGRPVTRYWRER